MRGGLRKTRIGGISDVMVPRRTESGEDFPSDRTSPVKGGMLTTTVDAERGVGVGTSH